ncbi:MAG: hypothetical protein RLN62_02895 [Rickettsiales bacterium]
MSEKNTDTARERFDRTLEEAIESYHDDYDHNSLINKIAKKTCEEGLELKTQVVPLISFESILTDSQDMMIKVRRMPFYHYSAFTIYYKPIDVLCDDILMGNVDFGPVHDCSEIYGGGNILVKSTC